MAGRPRREFTDKEIKQITDCALNGCQTTTIAEITGIPKDTLKRHFAPLLRKKRAERKHTIRNEQMKLVGQGNPTMLIFLGKNDLGQKDKQELKVGGDGLRIILERAEDESPGPGVEGE